MATQPLPAPVRQPVEPSPGPTPLPSPAQPPRRRWWTLAALIAVIGLGIALYLLLRPAPQTGGTSLVPAAPAPVVPVNGRVRLTGQTSARNYAQITVPVFRGPDSGGDLTLIEAAAAGSMVKKGDIVAKFDPQKVIDHLDDVRDQVEQAENDLKKRKADEEVEWVNLQQSLKEAKAAWDKALLDMKAAEVKTDIEREIYRLNAEEAEANYKQLQKEGALRKASQAAQMRILEITAERQRIHMNNHARDLEHFTLRTPLSGLAVMATTRRGPEQRQVQVGDQVYPGMLIMKIIDPNSMQMEGAVSQTDSGFFRVGQTATIGLDAFPELKFRGKIYSVGAMAVRGIWDTNYIRTVPIRISIEGRDQRLIPDLSAWALIETGQAKAGP